jgi:hypothetical protein
MDGVLYAAQAPLLDIVTSFVRALEDPEALAAILEHLRHEGHGFELAFVVQRRQNLFAAKHLDKVTRHKAKATCGLLGRAFRQWLNRVRTHDFIPACVYLLS